MTSQDLTDKPRETLPRHVAIVMDGNGRWAKQRGLPRLMGHQRGIESVRTIVECCGRKGIQYLSLFAFSSENWARPQEEVNGLMKIFMISLEKEIGKLHKAGVRVRLVGEMSALSKELQEKIRQTHELTKDNKGLTLDIYINYGSRWEILQAAKKLALLNKENPTEEDFSALMCSSDAGDVDLLIRTSGEQRISNFLLWQIAYAELYFTPVLWPDFGKEELQAALDWYGTRQRRFGKTAEQLAKS